jgi:hypothetical protein
MAPAASITDVCNARAAHGAVIVRHLHMAPAADARESTKTHAAVGADAGRAINKYRTSPPCHESANTDPVTHTRSIHTYKPPHRPSHTHTHTHSQTLTRTHARTHALIYANTRTHAHTHTHERPRTHKNARPHSRTQTHARMHAHARTRRSSRSRTRTCTHYRTRECGRAARTKNTTARSAESRGGQKHGADGCCTCAAELGIRAVPPRTFGARIGSKIGSL